MSISVDLPEVLNIPDKLIPVIAKFNDYRYFLLEGGRGSSKSTTVARFLLWLGEQKKLRIFCGREIQNSIEDSVHALLSDIISQFQLDYEVKKSEIVHRRTGTVIRFKGLREQGAVNVKSLEGCDILWIEEAQSISKFTLDIVIPTIREENARIFFTMNRYVRNDAVFEAMAQRSDCLHIHIDYYENKFCPLALKIEAEECKKRSVKDYRHIWLGEPLTQADDYLFNTDALAKCELLEFDSIAQMDGCVMGVDLSGRGEDLCSAARIDRKSLTQWDLSTLITWDEPDTMVSTGRVIDIYGSWKPDVCALDADGMGAPIFDRINETRMVSNLFGFKGSSNNVAPVRHRRPYNARAEGYLILNDWVESGLIRIRNKVVTKQLEQIRIKYTSSGQVQIESKKDMKSKRGLKSPDESDSVMMAVYGAVKYLGATHKREQIDGYKIKRISKRRY